MSLQKRFEKTHFLVILRAISHNLLSSKKLVWILHRATEFLQSFQALSVLSISKYKKEGTLELHINLKKARGLVWPYIYYIYIIYIIYIYWDDCTKMARLWMRVKLMSWYFIYIYIYLYIYIYIYIYTCR